MRTWIGRFVCWPRSAAITFLVAICASSPFPVGLSGVGRLHAWQTLPAPASDAGGDDEGFAPGLVATLVDEHGRTATRVDPGVSFHWDGPPDRRLEGRAFSARWDGYLQSQATGPYRLHAFVHGELHVRLGDHAALEAQTDKPMWVSSEPISLSFDWHPLEIHYVAAKSGAALGLFWSGPRFSLEPIPARQFFHSPEQTPGRAFERGEQLVRALRCTACHKLAGEAEAAPAPALDKVDGNLEPNWIVQWLLQQPGLAAAAHLPSTQGVPPGDTGPIEELARRMPHFNLTAEDARAIAALLVDRSSERPRTPTPGKHDAQARHEGERLFLTLGCLACHRHGQLGTRGLFTGGDLDRVAEKRPADFFERWLLDPLAINRRHRMPVYELVKKEREALALFLSDQRSSDEAPSGRTFETPVELVERGAKLFDEHHCAACHAPEAPAGATAIRTLPVLGPDSRWQNACTAAERARPRQPSFPLTDSDQAAVREYILHLAPSDRRAANRPDGRMLLIENNCRNCHSRDGERGLAERLVPVAAAHGELAPLLPAMTPPSLTSVGDKLQPAALSNAIRRSSAAHRPWLLARMPRFPISDETIAAVTNQLISSDRVPDGAPATLAAARGDVQLPDELSLEIAGRRLVTQDGFGCTSCHGVGKVEPPPGPLNARGPDLALLSKRVRREWFDRWVRDPARIVPRMEMPSIQLPVRGVLDERVDTQLEAVWHVLNRPGFVPPEPNPIRTLRRSGIAEHHERPAIVTDVLRIGDRTLIHPLAIGLPNRHNLVLDLAASRVAAWTIGDLARQRTKGKSWFWELAAPDLLGSEMQGSEFVLVRDGEEHEPLTLDQFPTEIDQLTSGAQGVVLEQRLRFPAAEAEAPRTVRIRQEIMTAGESPSRGVRRAIVAEGLAPEERLRLRTFSPARETRFDPDRRITRLDADGRLEIAIVAPEQARFAESGTVMLEAEAEAVGLTRVAVTIEYRSRLPVDQFPVVTPPPAATPSGELRIAPGWQATRLPLSSDMMPSALAWRPDGSLAITSLKGQLFVALDTDGDTLEDRLDEYADGLAAPYGLAAGDGYIDVIHKSALVRLHDDDGDGRADRLRTLASGWGHTDDYHDWAIGLPSDQDGNYYIGTACQQDERSPRAARWRGHVLKLSPRQPSWADPREFDVESLSAGHRFPMGLARRRDGELFVTDNQGNYNPFNELNHVRRGAHFGFINAVERQEEFRPTLVPPAIDIPHPWTRSVNGICFLESETLAADRAAFGPFAGHLVGCEYDTRRLIRMSLQTVRDTLQGAAYPLTVDPTNDEQTLLGPIVAAVSRRGDLYVGGIRDSGWGGGNNVGEIVRLRFRESELPAGIAEVRAIANGFVIRFTAPVDLARGTDSANYVVSSYTRQSTPAYGGPDLERRKEETVRVTLDESRQEARLELASLREQFVYEFRLKNLTRDDAPFFPAEAYYTLRVKP